MANSSTFIKITNKDIYDKIAKIDTKLDDFCTSNQKQHSVIAGKSSKAVIVAGTCLTLVLILMSVVIAHLANK